MCDQGVGYGFFQQIGRFSVIFESQVKVYEVMLCILVFQSIQRFATGRLASKGPVSLSTRSYTCWPMETQLGNSCKNILHSNGRIFLLVLTTRHREELHHGILIVRLKQIIVQRLCKGIACTSIK